MIWHPIEDGVILRPWVFMCEERRLEAWWDTPIWCNTRAANTNQVGLFVMCMYVNVTGGCHYNHLWVQFGADEKLYTTNTTTSCLHLFCISLRKQGLWFAQPETHYFRLLSKYHLTARIFEGRLEVLSWCFSMVPCCFGWSAWQV